MAKVITFSRTFPAYHTKKGKPTFFVEKFLNSKSVDYTNEKYLQKLLVLNTKNIAKGKLSFEDIESFFLSLQKVEVEKFHTIRAGERFEFMDFFSPRCWFGRPYFDPQIIFYDDTAIHNVFKFDIKDRGLYINNGFLYQNGTSIYHGGIEKLAKNDGLSTGELFSWFEYPKPFKGQIICWNDKIKY